MIEKTTRFLVAAVLLLASPLVSVARAQGTTASIVGTVTDSTGAAVPGATVTGRNMDTGFTRTTTAAGDGTYRLEFLPIGRYTVDAVLDGFKTAHRTGIVLRVEDIARVDVAMEIGVLAETVNVNAAAPLVNTSSTEIGRTIEAAAIASLPLVDRNVYTLLDLTPGVQSNNNGVAAASTGTSSLVLGYPEQRTLINGGADGGIGIGELLPRRRHQHDRAAQHRQHPAQPGRHSGIQGPDQQLQRGIRPVRQRRDQRRHQVGDERVSRLAVRFLPQRQLERQGLRLAGGQPAARSQAVRRRAGRAAPARQDVLLRVLLGAAAEHRARS